MYNGSNLLSNKEIDTDEQEFDMRHGQSDVPLDCVREAIHNLNEF